MKRSFWFLAAVLCTALLMPPRAVTATDDQLGKRASWSVPSAAEVKARLDQWLEEAKVDQATRLKVEGTWSAELDVLSPDLLLERLVQIVALVDPAVQPLIDLCHAVPAEPSARPFPFLQGDRLPPFVRANLRLYYGRWLAQHDLFDEALTQLDGLDCQEVVDPASLLFYQAVAYHQLLRKKECLAALQRLMENPSRIPHRYRVMANLMIADIEPLKTDSLDEIARLMDDIHRRQRLYRAGKRVRQEEEEVLKKLDKLIDQIEQQLQQQASAAGGSSGNNRSTQPLPDSVPAGGRGEGNVDPRKVGRGGNWGDLPPKERQAALQELSKDLPAHYREVIEEYFRKLARDEPK